MAEFHRRCLHFAALELFAAVSLPTIGLNRRTSHLISSKERHLLSPALGLFRYSAPLSSAATEPRTTEVAVASAMGQNIFLSRRSASRQPAQPTLRGATERPKHLTLPGMPSTTNLRPSYLAGVLGGRTWRAEFGSRRLDVQRTASIRSTSIASSFSNDPFQP